VNTVIEASGLGKRYGRRWALADCTLAVPAGRVTGLVGPNGAGKSTLLQLAAGQSASSRATARACLTPSSRRATSRRASYRGPPASPSLA
jgi:ABC-2 type transport system ATP-binding protein